MNNNYKLEIDNHPSIYDKYKEIHEIIGDCRLKKEFIYKPIFHNSFGVKYSELIYTITSHVKPESVQMIVDINFKQGLAKRDVIHINRRSLVSAQTQINIRYDTYFKTYYYCNPVLNIKDVTISIADKENCYTYKHVWG